MSNDPTDHPPGTAHHNDRGLRLRMASEARRVHSQHTQLSALLEDLRGVFDTGTVQMIRGAFEHFADAFDAHMRVEETLYFPALHGLLPEVDPDLTALTDEHRELRERLDAIRTKLAAHETDEARSTLEALAEQSAKHEAIEETLIERVRADTNGSGH